LQLKDKNKYKYKSRFWKTIRNHGLAKIGLFTIIFLSLLSILGPYLISYKIDEINLKNGYEAPNSEHWLGTDRLGRDVLVRLLYAGRISLLVGLSGTVISAFIGIIFGSISGYFGGRIDSILLKIQEIQLCFPSIILVISLMSLFGGGVYRLIIFLGLFNWISMYRLTRGQFISLREQEYVESAKVIGASKISIMFKHILPNALAPIVVTTTLQVAVLILAEAGLSFLGLGVQPPIPSWGNMLSSAQQLDVLRNMYWLWIPPGIMISITVLAINFLGDGLRDAIDPYTNK
jgi:peptide/nickel transport system permease protein